MTPMLAKTLRLLPLIPFFTACAQQPPAPAAAPAYVSEAPLPKGWPQPGPYNQVSEKNYPAYRAKSMHIGSGVVEAACKHVVGARCKRAGMRWTQTGAQTTLALRTQLLNDRWDDYWQPLKAAA